MLVITEANAIAYLSAQCPNWMPFGLPLSLGGGISNTVLQIDTGIGSIVLKQALPKLRVAQDWFSDPARTLREAQALNACAKFLPIGGVPQVLLLDQENFIYAMESAPNTFVDWKHLLMSGIVDQSTASKAGDILGRIIAASWRNPHLEQEFGDQTVFQELRLEPYYESTARKHSDLATFFENLILSCHQRRLSLVHGDWSPKNLLVSADQVMAIDFEVIHFGDPSFDAGFLLTHLMLKSFHCPQLLDALEQAALAFFQQVRQHLPESPDEFEDFTIRHWGALLLARMDGKSPAEYIQDDPTKQRIRLLARQLIGHPSSNGIAGVWSARRKI